MSACSLKRCLFPTLSYLNFVHLFYLLINNYVDIFCFIMTPLSSKFIYIGKTSTVIFYFNATQTYMMRGGQNVRKTNASHCSCYRNNDRWRYGWVKKSSVKKFYIFNHTASQAWSQSTACLLLNLGSTCHIDTGLKVGLPLQKKCVICFDESPLKMMKNVFYFTWKAVVVLI